jgi:hypothetical protein
MNIGQVLNAYKAHLDATITKRRGLIAIGKLRPLNKYEVRDVSSTYRTTLTAGKCQPERSTGSWAFFNQPCATRLNGAA